VSVSRIPNVEGGIQPTIVTAKGDLIAAVANASPGRLGIGSDGQLLTADSTAATGLSYQNNFAAGKNKIINGDFNINQRNFSSGTSYDFGFDRFVNAVGGGTGTATFSAQTFTPGTAPVAGYEAKNYLRCVTTGQTAAGTFTIFQQNIEDVRTLAGQTATVSFWAKAASGTPKMFVEFEQGFGSGGSANVTIGSSITISTSWTRYSVTLNVPSISGKTIGTSSLLSLLLWVSGGSTFNSRTSSLGIQSNTFDIWGVQVEQGSTATAFQTATGTLQGELAACQRYYWRTTANSSSSTDTFSLPGWAYSSTNGNINFQCPVPMRVKPTSVDFANLQYMNTSFSQANISAITINAGNNTIIEATITSTSLSSGMIIVVRSNGSATGFIGFSAEL
jgi:hypothetical protein